MSLAVLPARTQDVIRPLLRASKADVLAHVQRHRLDEPQPVAPAQCPLQQRDGFVVVDAADEDGVELHRRQAGERLLSGQATLRQLDMRRFDDEVGLVIGLYNAAWERNWGFVPMAADEIDHLAKALKPVTKRASANSGVRRMRIASVPRALSSSSGFDYWESGQDFLRHPDLFHAFPNSYGTLGYSVRLKIELEPVKPFVALNHLRFHTLDDLVATMDRIIETGGIDGTRTWEQLLVWGAEYLDWNLRFVIGYPGTPALMLATSRSCSRRP